MPRILESVVCRHSAGRIPALEGDKWAGVFIVQKCSMRLQSVQCVSKLAEGDWSVHGQLRILRVAFNRDKCDLGLVYQDIAYMREGNSLQVTAAVGFQFYHVLDGQRCCA